VGNAAGHGPAKRLQVRISDAGDSTVIEVHDDGSGNWSLTRGSP